MQLAMTRTTHALGRRVAVLLSAYDVSRDRLYGLIKKRKGRIEFLDFCRYVRLLYTAEVRLHFVLATSPRTRPAGPRLAPTTTTSSSSTGSPTSTLRTLPDPLVAAR